MNFIFFFFPKRVDAEQNVRQVNSHVQIDHTSVGVLRPWSCTTSEEILILNISL